MLPIAPLNSYFVNTTGYIPSMLIKLISLDWEKQNSDRLGECVLDRFGECVSDRLGECVLDRFGECVLDS